MELVRDIYNMYKARNVCKNRGVLFIEFAIVLPFLVFFLFGVIYFGLWMHDYEALNNITRNATRYAAVSSSGDINAAEGIATKKNNVINYVNESASKNLILYGVTLSESNVTEGSRGDEKITVAKAFIDFQTDEEEKSVTLVIAAKKAEACPIIIDEFIPDIMISSLKMKLEG